MIKAVYNRKKNMISVEGHAYSGEPGHDLICASASMLSYTIAVAVENMKAAGHVGGAVIDLKSGAGVVSCEPYEKFKAAITLIFDSICAGYELLAANYPDNVSYEMKE